MATQSVRKKSSKRSSNAKPTSSNDNSMALSAPPFYSNYRIVPLLISAVMSGFVLIILSISWKMSSAIGSDPTIGRIYSGEVVHEFPHDPNAFTQGLLYGGNDTLFESTGLNGRSSVRRVYLGTGKVEAIHRMPHSYFGEGLTLLGDRLFQVTWRMNTGFIYDRNSLAKIKKFNTEMQDGWGLATNGEIIFETDGSSTLYHIDPKTFKVVRKHIVRYNGHEVHNLNELEYVNGEVWANVWQTDCIARISGKDGVVLGWIYLPNLREGLLAAGNTGIDVLNGIAWDEERNRLFVTGKLWPKLYEIKLQPMKKSFKGNIETLCMLPRYQFG